MITEEQVVRFFDQANPIPDVELLDMEQIGAARHLATLEQRSSEVTRLDTKTQDNREKNKKNVMAFLVAAVVVIVAGIGFMVLTRGDEVLAAGPVTSFDDIAGTTYEVQQGPPNFIHFFEDGTVHHSSNRDLVEERPSFTQETSFEGTTVFLHDGREQTPCPDDLDSIYEIHLLENGNLQFVEIEDACQFRSNFFSVEWAPVP